MFVQGRICSDSILLAHDLLIKLNGATATCNTLGSTGVLTNLQTDQTVSLSFVGSSTQVIGVSSLENSKLNLTIRDLTRFETTTGNLHVSAIQ